LLLELSGKFETDIQACGLNVEKFDRSFVRMRCQKVAMKYWWGNARWHIDCSTEDASSGAKTIRRGNCMRSMFKLLHICLVSFLLGTCYSSSATVITSTYDPPDHLVTTFNSPYTYTHDLTAQGLPGLVVNSASLAVYLYDITDVLFSFGEKITFNFDNTTSSVVNNVSFFGRNYTFGVDTAMLADGLLTVSLSVGCNGSLFGHCVVPQDFVFAKSVLTADVSAPAQVPEPGSSLCFALGLLTLGYVMRKKNGKV
jgi:uncharacterized protein YcfL